MLSARVEYVQSLRPLLPIKPAAPTRGDSFMLRRNFLRNAAVGSGLLFGGNSLLGAKPAPAALPPFDPAGATAAASVDTAPDAVFEKQAPITTAEWARKQVKGVAAVEVNDCAGWIQRGCPLQSVLRRQQWLGGALRQQRAQGARQFCGRRPGIILSVLIKFRSRRQSHPPRPPTRWQRSPRCNRQRSRLRIRQGAFSFRHREPR